MTKGSLIIREVNFKKGENQKVDFELAVELYDSAGRTGFKFIEFLGVTDFATMQTEAAAYVDDLQAVTELEVIAYTIKHRTVYGSGVLTSGANIDEAGVFSVRKTDGYKASHRVPGIIQAARASGNDSLDITQADVVAYFENFISGNAKVSDGESVTALLKGTLEK